ncbi:hypothetical protein C8F01DRAFT_1246183 [Mycena amicta]|nr:hypothetical protein C8F01DRAFT_1246183 [Mycena amicta]
MEEVGLTDSKAARGKTRSRATSVSRVIIEDDVEGEDGRHDEEAERSKAREEQFLKLSGQFRGRKQAIDEIMTKLDSLSRAVTDFHALQAPKLEFPNPAPRQDSVPVTSTATYTDSLASPVFTGTDPRSGSSTVPQSRKASASSAPHLRHVGEQETPQFVESPLSIIQVLPP